MVLKNTKHFYEQKNALLQEINGKEALTGLVFLLVDHTHYLLQAVHLQIYKKEEDKSH